MLMAKTISRVLRVASVALCLIVAASFLVFAVDQTKGASQHQQEELTGPSASTAHKSTSAQTGGEQEGSVHKALTETSNALTSPFNSIISSSSEWATRGVRLLLALLIYGFGLGYLARIMRVRA